MLNKDFINALKNLPDDMDVFILMEDGKHSDISWAQKNDHFNLIEVKVEPVIVSMSADRTIWADKDLLASGETPESYLEKHPSGHPDTKEVKSNEQRSRGRESREVEEKPKRS